MKTQLTGELKEKFMALYWGVEALSFEYDDKLYIVDGDMSQWHECFLSLKLLSDITDDEAILVAKMAVINVIDPVVTRKSDYGIKIDFNNGSRRLFIYDDCSGFSIEDYEKGEGWIDQTTIDHPDILKIFDYLRSQGFCLPFMGISVEELVSAGWVKIIE